MSYFHKQSTGQESNYWAPLGMLRQLGCWIQGVLKHMGRAQADFADATVLSLWRFLFFPLEGK